MDEKNLFIKELIRRVHQELLESRQEREASGEEAIFEVEKLTLEVNFIVNETKTAKGGLDFKIITAGADKQYQQQQIHKITLSLNALGQPPPAIVTDSALTDLEESGSRFRPRED